MANTPRQHTVDHPATGLVFTVNGWAVFQWEVVWDHRRVRRFFRWVFWIAAVGLFVWAVIERPVVILWALGAVAMTELVHSHFEHRERIARLESFVLAIADALTGSQRAALPSPLQNWRPDEEPRGTPGASAKADKKP